MSKAKPLSDAQPTQRKGAPLPTDPGQTGYGAPPPAPLPGAPSTPLTGTRQRGGARPVGWNSPSSRRPPQFTDTTPAAPVRRLPQPVLVSAAVVGVVALIGAAILGYRAMDTFDTVANPLANPSAKQTEVPLAPPRPTVTVTATPVPDAVRVKQNGLYKAGKVAAVNCTAPAVKPSTEAAALRFYQAILPCLNRAWAPLVRKAGYEFRPPKVVLWAKGQTSCTGEPTDVAFYCGDAETITMRGDQDSKLFRQDATSGRIHAMDTLAHEYGHHVQMLTNILISSSSRKGWAKTEPAKLEESRRLELQASCLGAAFLGANKTALGITGQRLETWEWQTKHSGDEYNPKKVRDHGSRKNNWLWSGASFKTTNPASCNTFTAPAAKVS
ncbi:neutral zinc metallopeptidase [Kribbella sp. NPDC051770]|uniref:neutral zinc metallopeptidase n=1 Tax=Kribbella sp. NPDC051770 TaxID=3155413 RepID=UPI0034251BE1